MLWNGTKISLKNYQQIFKQEPKLSGYISLQKRFALKLAKALESGKYEQCRANLRTNDTYCCLGVACDIFLAEKDAIGKWAKDEKFGGGFVFENDGLIDRYALPPQVALKLSGSITVVNPLLFIPPHLLGNSNRELSEEQNYASMTNLNDVCQFNFTQIAECLRFTLAILDEIKKNKSKKRAK